MFFTFKIQNFKEKMKIVSILAGQNIHGDKCLEIGGSKIKLIGYVDQNEILTYGMRCICISF